MKKEELFETLSDLDPAMVKKARDYQRSQGAAWKKWTVTAACAVKSRSGWEEVKIIFQFH